jgi:hypothetical protein
MSQLPSRYNIYDLQVLPIKELVEIMRSFVLSSAKNEKLLERITKPLIDRA